MDYRRANFIANNRVVVNIKGNEYRLVAAIHYGRGMLYMRFVGRHAECDRIDVTKTMRGAIMDIKPLYTKADYENALRELECLWDAAEGSTGADRLEVLTLMVHDYEAKLYPIADPGPIAFLEHVMEVRELTRKGLEPFVDTRKRVAEVLNRRRPLTLEMIRNPSSGLKLHADVLVRPYRLRHRAA